jgi:putative glycerol-1-phosphate prenyltransferase
MTKIFQNIYSGLVESKREGKKKIAVLIDPDKVRKGNLDHMLRPSIDSRVDYFLIGGSLMVNNMLDYTLGVIKEACEIPLILFPGNSFQINDKADAILLLSLISGRNPDLLIGHHVISAPILKSTTLEIISTGYMLIDGGVESTVSYMSNSKPIPADKADIAICTAMAGEMLGLKMIYLEAGSGAKHPVSCEMIEKVSSSVEVPLIIGGGLRTPDRIAASLRAGADLVVVGNALEKDPSMVQEMAAVVHGHKMVKSY